MRVTKRCDSGMLELQVKKNLSKGNKTRLQLN